jgi:hypothetical protein
MYHRVRSDSARRNGLGTHVHGEVPPDGLPAFRSHSVKRGQMDLLTVDSRHHTYLCVAQLFCQFADDFEHRLDLGGRARDDTQDFTCRGLVLQCFSEVMVAHPQLRKQPDVLNSDDRLVGEGMEQRDLLIWKRSGFGPADYDGADRFPIA